ncbi:MAG TPA: hypothetical protein VM261_24975 [Kofleriaceae bacterium]|nr:hypothetical protein [Kofleriaceae bacterium]
MSRAAAAALALAVLAGCPGDDTQETCDGVWTQLAELDRAALSVQGTGPDDVWIVGGGLGLGGPLAAHWDGERWTRHDPAGDDSLWWVWTASDGTVWMVGEHGLVARRLADGDTVTVDRVDDVTLYGVWGSGPDDVWIVGENDFVRRWNGAAFETLAGVPARGATLFKVWGSAPDDVWISGEGGTMLHGTSTGIVDHSDELATAAPALTVHGCHASEVYAVAGQSLYLWDGQRWSRQAEPVLGSAANGVSCGEAGVLVVGNAGLKLRRIRATGQWLDERAAAPTGVDLHGAWIDGAGRTWVVGGNFNAPMPTSRRGVVGERGCPRPANF